MKLDLPLIRGLSRPVSRALVALPVSANQVTAASLLAGLGAAWCLAVGTWEVAVLGAVLLVVCYLFDNADGDVARAKDQCSEFGKRFDSFVDWLVHTAFFLGLGVGAMRGLGDAVWLWLGVAAAAGGTINYIVGFIVEFRDRRRMGEAYGHTGHEAPEDSRRPQTWKEWAFFAFRELSRADFCFLVLILALADVAWVLLPAGAVGAQVYWMLQLVRGAHEYHV